MEKNLSGHRMKGPLELVCQFGLQSILSLSISYIFHSKSISIPKDIKPKEIQIIVDVRDQRTDFPKTFLQFLKKTIIRKILGSQKKIKNIWSPTIKRRDVRDLENENHKEPQQ